MAVVEWRFRDEMLERMLENWQRWYTGEGAANPLGYPSRSSFEPINTSGYREAAVPVLVGEALTIDGIVNKLKPSVLRNCIRMEYIDGPEFEQDRRAKLCGFDSRRTYFRRVDEAKMLIRSALNKRAGLVRVGRAVAKASS